MPAEDAMGQFDDLTDVIDGIYDAAVDPDHWSRALARMTEFLGFRVSNVLVVDSPTRRIKWSMEHGTPEECAHEYVQHYATICPHMEYAVRNPGVRVFTDHSHTDEAAMDRSEYYADYLARYDIRYCMTAKAVDTARTHASLVFGRPRRNGHAQADEIRRVELLLPHLGRAFELNDRLADVNLKSAAVEDMLDRMPTGVVLLDGRGKIVFMNAAATTMVLKDDGLSARGRRLGAAYAGDNARIAKLVRQAVTGARPSDAGTDWAVMVARPSGRRPFVVEIFPVTAKNHPIPSDGAAGAIVYLTDPDSTVVAPTETLAALFGLTPAESRLAAHLAAGASLTAASDELGIAKETARNHLKSIFQKTDTHRQSELVRLLTSGIGGLMPRDTFAFLLFATFNSLFFLS